MPISEIGVIYSPPIYGRTSFPLKHKGDPIFYKIFNAEDLGTVILNQNTNIRQIEKNVLIIPNHFFKTGEPLKYFNNGSSIGIAATSPGAAGITTLPEIIYPIVLDKDTFRVALASSYANSNDYVIIDSLGIGTQHSLEAFKQNSKSLITINNIIQSPISVASTVKVLSHTENILELESLQNIKVNTCLRVGNEIIKVLSINYDTNILNVARGSSILGTESIIFSSSLDGSYIDVLSGNYNIIKDVIYFDEPPLEGKNLTYKVPTSDIFYDTYSFNLVTDVLVTGTQVLILWETPPQGILKQKYYYIIKNSENNFSFAETYGNAINGTKIQFLNTSEDGFPITNFKLSYFYPSEENTFNGRIFLRSNYDGNEIFDDVSEQFTGISSSFELKSSGVSTVGIKSDNGIVLINNIFQYPGSDEVFSFVESGASTFLNFVGFGTTGFTGKNYDVNVKGYPRGGIIVSYGTTSGSNYQISTSFYNVSVSGSASGIGASVSFDTDQYGNVTNFKFTNRGYNYKVGEILVPQNTTGIGTTSTQSQDDKLHIRVEQTTKDTFNAWNIGILDKLDDISSKIDGSRKTFYLTKNGQRISLGADVEYEIDFPYNLLIFVNDVLQIPNSSYQFNGGSIITFTEPIPKESNVKIYFYKGYINDTFVDTSLSKIKEGDVLQLVKDIYNSTPVQQKERIVKEFVNADVLRTNIYSDAGLSDNSSQFRSITWTPQKTDLILDGTYVSKSRDEQNAGITTFTKLISYVGVGSTAVGISTILGTFVGVNTNIIGINTNSGIGSLAQINDYVESTYVDFGIKIVGIGTSSISISTTSNSPSGINTIPITFYRVNV